MYFRSLATLMSISMDIITHFSIYCPFHVHLFQQSMWQVFVSFTTLFVRSALNVHIFHIRRYIITICKCVKNWETNKKTQNTDNAHGDLIKMGTSKNEKGISKGRIWFKLQIYQTIKTFKPDCT